MSVDKMIKKLKALRDSIQSREEATITLSDKEKVILEDLKLSDLTLHDRARTPVLKAEGKILSKEQMFRLSMMEKTGTGSSAIH